jgi:hypothetical protein
MSFVCGDARDIKTYLSEPPAVVKMLGLCEHLTDRQIVDIAGSVAAVMPAGAPILFNNITRRHGNDRFLRRVFGVHMTYRSVEEISGLMRAAGFDNFTIHREPLGVYHVIVGHRAGAAAPRAAAPVAASTAAAAAAPGQGAAAHG